MDKGIIFTCFIAPFLYEMLKHLIFFAKDKLNDHINPYSISGYWVSFHSSKNENGVEYSAYELLRFKQTKNNLSVKLYQHTNDDRFHIYKGLGFIKGNRISLSYCESNDSYSNDIGTFNLSREEESQHTPCFTGVYTEFSKNSDCTAKDYKMTPLKISAIDRLLLSAFQSRYAKYYMNRKFSYADKTKVQ